MNEEMTMSVSPICLKDNKKYAFVRFVDKKKSCEWIIPDAKLSSNNGFSDDEISALKLYITTNMAQLKKTAAGINLFDAFKNG